MHSDFSALSRTSPSAAAFPVYSEYQYIRVADPDPVLFDPGIRDGKKSGSGMNIPDHFSESLETVFRAKDTQIL
jgi:hypothetical protein